MAENILIGKVIAISEEETIVSTEAGKEPFRKRKLFLDCTRYDQWTKEPVGPQSTPLLDFGGKVLATLNEMIRNGLKKDSVVSVKFQVVGRQVKKDGKMSVFNDIRPYAIELYRPSYVGNQYQSNHQPTGDQPAQQAAPQPAMQEPAPMAQSPFPPQEPQGTDGVLPF